MFLEEPSVKRELSDEGKAWNCINCTFLNSAYLTTCEVCGEDNPTNTLLQACASCGYNNKQSAKECRVCHQSFSQVNQKKVTTVYCPHCLFENHEKNQLCLNCGINLSDPASLEKVQVEVCPICAMELHNPVAAKQHIQQCEESIRMIQLLKKQEQDSIKSKPVPIKPKPFHPKPVKPPTSVINATKVCPNCLVSFAVGAYDSHILSCKPEQVDLSKIVKVKPTPFSLTPLQQQAVKYMHTTSKTKHDKARSSLLGRIKKLGHLEKDLEALEHYVQNYAPIIVHIHVSRHMEFFVKDTHYRNQFETGKSSGSLSRDSRVQWQNRMFSNKYSAAKDFERVKYGTINFTNDPAGVTACRSYGNSYFLLKSDVRQRCTFTDMDSSSASALIGTFKYGDHILSKLSDAELKAAINAAKANEVSSSVVTTYKEIQIHGPLQFARDIQRLYVNKVELTTPVFKRLVEEFSAKFGVDYQIF